jgi:hypothetical protein
MSRHFVIAAALLACPVAALAGATDDLYRAQAIVTGQGEVERARGFALCLDDVLVKLSGDPRLVGDPRLQPLEATAGQFVAAFAYHDRMSGIPVHDEQGTRERPFDLSVTFDQAKTDAALRALGLEPWIAPRPRLVVVLGIRDATTAYVLAEDGERGLGQRQSLLAASLKRGMPIALPDTAALAAAGVSFDGLATAHWPPLDPLAKRTGGDLALAGTLVWDEPALGWIADWHLYWQGSMHHWRVGGVSFDDAFRGAIGGALQIVSGHGDPP